MISNEKKKIYQDVFGPGGNCMSACLATLFGCELIKVPNFYLPGESESDWWRRVKKFVAQRGWCITTVSCSMDVACQLHGYQLIGGLSPRGHNHSVIYLNGVLWHDPHFEGGGVLVDSWDVLFPLNPELMTYWGGYERGDE